MLFFVSWANDAAKQRKALLMAAGRNGKSQGAKINPIAYNKAIVRHSVGYGNKNGPQRIRSTCNWFSEECGLRIWFFVGVNASVELQASAISIALSAAPAQDKRLRNRFIKVVILILCLRRWISII